MKAKDLNIAEKVSIETAALIPIFDVIFEAGIPDDLEKKLEKLLEEIYEIRIDALLSIKGKLL